MRLKFLDDFFHPFVQAIVLFEVGQVHQETRSSAFRPSSRNRQYAEAPHARNLLRVVQKFAALGEWRFAFAETNVRYCDSLKCPLVGNPTFWVSMVGVIDAATNPSDAAQTSARQRRPRAGCWIDSIPRSRSAVLLASGFG